MTTLLREAKQCLGLRALARPVLIRSLVLASLLAGNDRVLAQMNFENVSQAATIAALPRAMHPDPKIAGARHDFENVYASGYFYDIRDVTFADMDGDGNLDVFLLSGKCSRWSRLWLGNGKGGFQEMQAAVEGIDRTDGETTEPHSFWLTVPCDFEGHGAQSLFLSGPGSGGGDVGGTGGSSRRLSLAPRKAGPALAGQTQTTGPLRMREEGIWSAGKTILIADFDGDGCVDLVTGGMTKGGDKEDSGRLVCGMLRDNEIEWGRTWVSVPTGGGDMAADFDNDGRTDILCRGPQGVHLLRNDGDRRFTDVTPGSGLEAIPSVGPVAVADFDNDGKLDVFAAGTLADGKTCVYRLYRNMGGGVFQDVSSKAGFDPDGKAAIFRSGTAVAADFDNDGRIDLLVCEGGRQRFYRNLGDMRFQDVTEKAGIPGAVTPESSNAAGDYDNDGRVDLVYVTPDRGAGLLHNTTRNDNGWIKVRLVGPPGNPEGAGARVTVFAPGQLGNEKAIVGYQEYMVATDFKIARPLHFGLGTNKTCDLRVIFPGGKTVERRGVQAGSVADVSVPERASL